MVSEDIKRRLTNYNALKKKKQSGKITLDEFKKRKADITEDIQRLVEREISILDIEKKKLVFKMTDLEDSSNEGAIDGEEYDTGHRQINDRLVEINSELSKLRAGKNDILKLEYKQDQRGSKKYQMLFFVLFITIFMVGYLSHKDVIDLEEIINKIIYQIKKASDYVDMGLSDGATGKIPPIELPSSHILNSIAKGILLPNGTIEADLSKPPFPIEITSIKGRNPITGKLCGYGLIDNIDPRQSEVKLPLNAGSFRVSLIGCGDIENMGNDKVKTTIHYSLVIDGIDNERISDSEITFSRVA